jgi:transposase
MIRLSDKNKTTGEIAHLLGFPRATVHHVIRRFNALGLSSLADQFRGGRPPSLDKAQLLELKELLLQGPTAHGWFNDLWTSKRVRRLIHMRFGVSLSAGSVSKILKNSLGWTPQRPRHQDRKRDEHRIQSWKTTELNRIKREARRRRAYLSFSDETGFMLMLTRRRTYAPRGCQPVHKVSDPHGRISTIGVITISPRRRRLNFHFHLLPDNLNFHGDSIAEFLKTLYIRVRAPMTLIWDSYRIHSSKEAKGFRRRESRDCPGAVSSQCARNQSS